MEWIKIGNNKEFKDFDGSKLHLIYFDNDMVCFSDVDYLPFAKCTHVAYFERPKQ